MKKLAIVFVLALGATASAATNSGGLPGSSNGSANGVMSPELVLAWGGTADAAFLTLEAVRLAGGKSPNLWASGLQIVSLAPVVAFGSTMFDGPNGTAVAAVTIASAAVMVEGMIFVLSANHTQGSSETPRKKGVWRQLSLVPSMIEVGGVRRAGLSVVGSF
jgi:hypothetical protein